MQARAQDLAAREGACPSWSPPGHGTPMQTSPPAWHCSQRCAIALCPPCMCLFPHALCDCGLHVHCDTACSAWTAWTDSMFICLKSARCHSYGNSTCIHLHAARHVVFSQKWIHGFNTGSNCGCKLNIWRLYDHDHGTHGEKETRHAFA